MLATGCVIAAPMPASLSPHEVEIRDDEQTATRNEHVIALLANALEDFAARCPVDRLAPGLTTVAGWWIGMT